MSIRKVFSLFFVCTFALLVQKMPLVYAVENTCSDCTKPPLLTVDQLPVIQNLPILLPGLIEEVAYQIFAIGDTDRILTSGFILIFLIRENCNSN